MFLILNCDGASVTYLVMCNTRNDSVMDMARAITLFRWRQLRSMDETRDIL
jgi:hypothetical protein